jgi:hypothetical protein
MRFTRTSYDIWVNRAIPAKMAMGLSKRAIEVRRLVAAFASVLQRYDLQASLLLHHCTT